MLVVTALSSSSNHGLSRQKLITTDTSTTISSSKDTNMKIDDEFRVHHDDDDFNVFVSSPTNDRRKFLSSTAGGFVAALVAGGGFMTSPADAATDNTNTVNGVKVSKRAGGLAQKIRGGVCLKMVRYLNFIMHGICVELDSVVLSFQVCPFLFHVLNAIFTG
jgi:hypothetical protein